jgi:DNA-binding transcriptional LysR family regulator
MTAEINDLAAFISVARAGGFRDAARKSQVSASGLSSAVRRLESRLGVRLLNRTTRSVAPTEAGARLIERLTPVLSEMEAALDVLNAFRDRPAGTLKLNVPANVARTVLGPVLARFLQDYPDVLIEVTAEDRFVDLLAAGCDAGIRYEERLEQDMIAIPIGPRTQCLAAAAAPSYLNARGRPQHPRDLLSHSCLRGQFSGGAQQVWEFERAGEVIRVDPPGPLIVRPGAAMDLLINTAVAGLGIVRSFEDMLQPHFARGTLEPVLRPWWQSFSGPFLYYPGRRHLPAPLRAFVDFIKNHGSWDGDS